MKTNAFYTWLPVLMTVVVTVLGFVVFAPEEVGALFYTNLVYTVVLEGLFFGWFHMHRLKSDADQTPFFKVFVGMHTMSYLVVSVVWVLLYSCVLEGWVEIKVYWFVIAVISLLWCVVASIVGSRDSSYHSEQKSKNK